MNKSALPEKWRLRHSIWLIALLLLAACNLNTTEQNTNQVISGEPQVSILSPKPNATFLEGVQVNIQVRIANAGPDINRVEIAVDDTIVSNLDKPNSSGAAAFSIAQSWQAAGIGSHAITVTAIREDGTTSAPQSVTVNIVDQAGQGAQQETEDNNSGGETNGETDNDNNALASASATPSAPTDVPPPSDTPQPEATSTPSRPMATFTTGVNVRRGPDTLFEPPIGSFAANDTAEIVAVNPARTWYKVKYYNSEGWVFANLLSVSGDAANLPTDAGPPVPTVTPIPPTPIPVTATPQTNVNMVAGNIRLDKNPPKCKETFNISFDVANLGTSPSPSGSINVEDTSNGLVTRTIGSFPSVPAGQTIAVGPIPLTVDTNFEAEHTLALIIDPGGQIPENNENDNRNQIKYTLQRGTC